MVENYILAVDPGDTNSAYCLCSPDLRPLAFEKCRNRLSDDEYSELKERTGADGLPQDIFFDAIDQAVTDNVPFNAQVVFVIEGIENFGMPAGKTLFDTAEYIGWLSRMIYEKYGKAPHKIYRHEEKMTICHSVKANDATIKRALVDRFALGASNYGKGTKKNPGFFYGFKADCWSAFAICCTYHDKYLIGDLHLEDLPF